MMEWKPIETAPMDGTRILGYCQPEGLISITSSTGNIINVWSAAGSYSGPAWNCESEVASDRYGWSGHDDWLPTHWMPLPEPPK